MKKLVTRPSPRPSDPMAELDTRVRLMLFDHVMGPTYGHVPYDARQQWVRETAPALMFIIQDGLGLLASED